MNKLILILLTVLVCNCASIVSQHTYNVSINRHPGSMVKVRDINNNIVIQDTSPFKVKLRSNAAAFKRNNYTIDFEKDNQIIETYILKCRLDPWIFGNVFLGAIPLVIDGLNGSMYKLDKKTIR